MRQCDPVTHVTIGVPEKYAKILIRILRDPARKIPGGSFAMTRRSLLIALMSASGALAVADIAPKPQDKLAQANENVKQLLLLLDADQNGRISKKEWMAFMEAEFNKLDKDGNGELDQKELMQARLSVRQGSPAKAK
jgi:EF hand domain-containing protein